MQSSSFPTGAEDNHVEEAKGKPKSKEIAAIVVSDNFKHRNALEKPTPWSTSSSAATSSTTSKYAGAKCHVLARPRFKRGRPSTVSKEVEKRRLSKKNGLPRGRMAEEVRCHQASVTTIGKTMELRTDA